MFYFATLPAHEQQCQQSSDEMTGKTLEQTATNVVQEACLGNIEAISVWLGDEGHDLENRATHESVLWQAAEHGHTHICQLIIDSGTVTATDALTYALNKACFYGRLPVVKLLVSALGHRFDADMLNTKLTLATAQTNVDVVEFLLSDTRLSINDAEK